MIIAPILFIFITFFTIPALAILSSYQFSLFEEDRWRNKDYRKKWIFRINEKLETKGYVGTNDFEDIGMDLSAYKEINFCLAKFFELYEFKNEFRNYSS